MIIKSIMKRLCILALMCLMSIIGLGQRDQHIPYPVIFIHGLNGANTTWDEMKTQLEVFGWRYGGNMDFNLNYDGDNSTSILEQDFHDFNKPLQAGDFYTINFDVDVLGNFGTGNNLSNQAAIVKQGRAVSKAIQHVLDITGRDKVILIGHSMGGLSAREYLQNESNWVEAGNHHVAKLFTVGTPHGGSDADFGFVIDYIGSLTKWAKGLDVLSEAVRDLRTKYFYSRQPGVYLFDGKESSIVMLDQFGNFFYNIDVNCNGQTGDDIKGLNSKMLPDLPYSCIIGTDFSQIPGLGGDGIVSEKSANLNYWFSGINADTFIVHNAFHTDLTSQFFSIMKGMDEPGLYRYAYNVNIGNTYEGLITFPPANSPTASDIDDYAVDVPSGGKLNIQVNNIPVNVFTVSVYNSNYNRIYTENRYGANFMNVDVPISEATGGAGKYYVVLAGIPSPTSWQLPYSFKLGFTASPPPSGTCYTVLSEASGAFNDGSGSSDYSNNMDCSWLIQPQDASTITLHFNNFATEAANDTVYVYNGSDNSYPLLGKYSGSAIPPYIVSSGGSMFVEFKTNGSVTAAGWEASYNAEIGDIIPIHIPGKITAYKYWFDGDINNGSTINLAEKSAVDIDELITVNSLQKGFHSFSFMAKQTDGRWSAPVSSLFFYLKNSDPAIYEYWYDSLYADRKTISISDTSDFILKGEMLDASKLTNGYHQFNMRFKPNGGFWTPVQNEIFFKSGNAIISERHLAQMEYWFDSSYNKAVLVTTVDTSNLHFNNPLLDASALSEGFHQVNFRFRSNDSLWTAVQSSLIYKHQKVTIDAFEYWFDDGVGNKKKVTFAATQSLVLDNELIDASELSNGFHQLNILFLSDGTSIASSVLTAMIFKRGNDVNSEMDIKKIRYWFNGDFSTVKEMQVSGQSGVISSFIDCGGLPTGKNTFSYQMMDNGNIWSSVIIDTFLNANIPLIVNGKVFLQGTYNTSSGSMNNTLNTSGLLSTAALNQPYNSGGFSYQGTEHVASDFFTTHADIVDWVLVELRDAAIPLKVIATRAALVRQDGTLIETDGTTSGIKFLGVVPGNYYVAIRHRNHLGIRSSSSIDFTGGSGNYDFTSSANKSYQNQTYTSTVSIGGVWAMRAGNANSNSTVKYNGPGNDQSQILNSKLFGSLSNILNNVYSPEDINMDGKVRWNGPGNEQNFLLNTLLQGSLTTIYMEQL